MRILFVVHGYKPATRFGGPILSVSAVAEELVRRGHEVHVFTTNSNLDEILDVPTNVPIEVHGVQVSYFEHHEPLRNLLPWIPYVAKSMGFLYSPMMARALEEFVPRTDLVHTHLPFIYPTYAAARAAFRYRKPLFYHQRGVLDPERLRFRSVKKRAYLRFVELPILRRAATLIALTDAEITSYRQLGVDTKCCIVPNGIACDEYLTRGTTEAVPDLGIRSDDWVILFLGRIHPTKGADCLLDSFIEVSRHCPNALLVMAGPDEFGLQAQLQQRALRSGVADRVRFPGMIQGETKKRVLARADLFCLPSIGEGFSMAVLEAMASETAVLLSPGCHFPEVARAGVGLIVERSTAAVAAGLRTMLADRSRLRSMGIAARDFVRANYSWATAIDLLLKAYSEGGVAVVPSTSSLSGQAHG
jgi:glycosyltransferase involved in cell wall biosynthesis